MCRWFKECNDKGRCVCRERFNQRRDTAGVTSIGRYAFEDCENLKELQIVVSSDKKYQFLKVGTDAFTNLPDPVDRKDIHFVNDSGEEICTHGGRQ